MTRRIPWAGVVLAAVTATAQAEVDGCQATPTVKAETSLREMASAYFGDHSYRYAILLATNARAGTKPFGFIGDPHRIGHLDDKGKWVGPEKLCIPALPEAERLRHRYQRYLEAVADMALAEPAEVVTTLDPVEPADKARVVSWIRADQAAGMPAPGEVYRNDNGATWVTIDPHLRRFCRDYVANHTDEAHAVTLRLEQRLGLPPAASKTHFVTFEITNPTGGRTLFRPCGDTEVTDRSCNLGPPKKCAAGDATCDARRDFFFEQYYSSYGREAPVEYPWTSLGYTFDWAPSAPGLGQEIGFVTVGESEYVVPAGTDMKVLKIEETMAFCTGAY